MIFIEGLPCAGKSLLINALAAQGEAVCFELGKVLKREDFPGNGRTLEEVEYINNWFIEHESQRMQDKAFRFFDRSYLTHLCYAWAYSRLTSLDMFESTVRKYHKKIADGSLPLPTRVIYVDIVSSESIARQNNKIVSGISRGLPAFWRDTQFLDDTRYAYQQLFASFTHIPVLSITGQLTTDEKVKQVNHWLNDATQQGSAGIDCDLYIKYAKKG
ncbi:AAA family ATPase [Kosakonia oryzendophytica]|uniref:AAA family ATPase n=1 Tax=Kosakonia oryzendophytica TaxID=1005665 RepID=UPI003D333386